MKNPPAFPRSMISLNGAFGSSAYSDGYGMDLRDYFAAKAMQAMTHRGESNEKFVAEHSYLMADAMLKAREA